MLKSTFRVFTIFQYKKKIRKNQNNDTRENKIKEKHDDVNPFLLSILCLCV